jgi:hypothetical protein
MRRRERFSSTTGKTPLLSQILLVPMHNPEKSEEEGNKINCSLKYLIVDGP